MITARDAIMLAAKFYQANNKPDSKLLKDLDLIQGEILQACKKGYSMVRLELHNYHPEVKETLLKNGYELTDVLDPNGRVSYLIKWHS